MGKYTIHDFLQEDIPISQNYGDNIEYYKNFTSGALSHGHEGVDFKTPNGTPIFSPFDGIVVRDAFSGKDYGNFLVIWDPVQCCALWFCHLLDMSIKLNDRVVAGQLLGHTNNTGNTTGPHCHVNFVETDKDGIRLNTDNGEEGFLNLMDSDLVTYPWLPCSSTPIATSIVPPTFYRVGQEIEVSSPVATGASPDTINFSYGKIDATAPAKILDIVVSNGVAYYNIDQTFLGGGTGFAKVQDVDALANTQQATGGGAVVDAPVTPPAVAEPIVVAAAAPVVEPTPPVVTPETAAVEPQKQIENLRVQNVDLIGKVKEMGDKYKIDLEHYMGIMALGYTKAEDVLKALEEVARENTGLKKQMVEILKRNKAYHLDMAAKEEEDATAIETGMKFEKMFQDAQRELVTIAKAFKTKPSVNAILQIADKLQSAFETAMAQLQKKQTQQSVVQALSTVETAVADPVIRESGVSFIERLITFGKQ